ncbi:hypothetical protein DCW30_07495 [Streptomyces alfalfae]|nr:hypothetical protein D3X13_01805 [Streptomyces fradiae]RXX45724.1 hypothetical protein DCW30_07495 [Streptomyces alfalfae]RZM94476.1 hypothetical protein D4104_18460 [Streptomyces alfalfae]
MGDQGCGTRGHERERDGTGQEPEGRAGGVQRRGPADPAGPPRGRPAGPLRVRLTRGRRPAHKPNGSET